jgi:hypothetical protein
MLTPADGGVFIDPDNPSDIADTLLSLLRHPDRIRAMGMRNRERALQYYGNKLPAELLETYRRLCVR